ncbi:MAG: ABC transporter substrate-binding protein, partial [Microbacterium sp.]
MLLTPSLGRRSAVAAGAVIVGLTLASCTGDEPETAPAVGADPDATLRVGLVLAPDNLDIRHTSGAALEQILVDNVYQGLVTRTQEGEIVEALAEQYEVSDDGLTYSFALTEDVTFHGGGELTPSDVVASLQQVIDDDTVQGHDDFAGVASVEESSDGVVITLNEPNQNFLFTLTTPAGLIFDSEDDTDM